MCAHTQMYSERRIETHERRMGRMDRDTRKMDGQTDRQVDTQERRTNRDTRVKASSQQQNMRYKKERYINVL